MMKINKLDIYIARTVIMTTGLVLLALLGLQFLILFINELREIGTGDYGLAQAFSYVLLGQPYETYRLFPMIGLLGILLGLGLLASHSELIAMQAAGLSLKQITFAILKTACVMILTITLLGETLAPFAKRTADSRKTIARSAGQAINAGQGAWIRDGQNFIHIQRILSTEHLAGISRYIFDDQRRLILASYANHAYYRDQHWVFYNIVESQIQSNKVISKKQSEASWSLSLKPDLLKTIAIAPKNMPLWQLYQTISHREDNELNADSHRLAFWQRIWQPLASLVMMYLAIPFLFGPLRSATLGLRLVTGIAVGLGFYILNEFLGAASLAFQVPAVIMTAFPTLLFMAIGWGLMRSQIRLK
jgi:lipopolysaccharide export system permease protein